MRKIFFFINWKNPKKLRIEISDCTTLINLTLKCLRENIYTSEGVSQFKSELETALSDLHVANKTLSSNVWQHISYLFRSDSEKIKEWDIFLKSARAQWIAERLVVGGYLYDPRLVPTQVQLLESLLPEINPIEAATTIYQLRTDIVAEILELQRRTAEDHQEFLAKSMGFPNMETLTKETMIQVEIALEAARKNQK